MLVNNAGVAAWRDLDEVPDEDWRAQYELNVMAPLRAMRAAVPAMAERGWGRVVNVCSTAGKRPSAAMPEYSVAKAAELSLSRLFADRYAKTGVLVNAICPGPVESEMWMEPGGLLDQSRDLSGAGSREEALAEAGSKRPIGRLAEAGRDRRRDRLPLLRARLLRRRRRLVGRRRHRPGHHLIGARSRGGRASCPSTAGPRTPASSSPSAAPTCAATPARSPSPAAAATTATPTSPPPRCARRRRRSASTRRAVELGEALPPTTTFVTGYRVHPFVGRIPHPRELALQPNPAEVETVLTFSLELLRESYEMRRLVRRGVPIHTPTYEVEGHLIWGATARILGDLLDRLELAHRD